MATLGGGFPMRPLRIEFGVADAPGIEFGVSPWSMYHGDTKGIKAQLRIGKPAAGCA